MIVEAKGGNYAKLGTRYDVNSSNYEVQYKAEVDALKITIDTIQLNKDRIDYTVVHQKFDITSNKFINNHFNVSQYGQ